MRGIKLLLVAIVALTVFGATDIFAQERFGLERRGGHYFFAATINDVPADLMV